MPNHTDTHAKTPHLACCFKLAIYSLQASQFFYWVQHTVQLPHNKHESLEKDWSRAAIGGGTSSITAQAGVETMSKGVLMMLLVATAILLWLPLVLPPLSPPPLFLLFVPVVMMLLLFSLVLFPSHHCAYSSPTFTQ